MVDNKPTWRRTRLASVFGLPETPSGDRVRLLVAAAALVVVVVCLLWPAKPAAQGPVQQCTSHDVLARFLTDRGERRVAFAISSDGFLIEIWAADKGAWSLLTTRVEGRTCLFGWGNGFKMVAPAAPEAPES